MHLTCYMAKSSIYHFHLLHRNPAPLGYWVLKDTHCDMHMVFVLFTHTGSSHSLTILLYFPWTINSTQVRAYGCRATFWKARNRIQLKTPTNSSTRTKHALSPHITYLKLYKRPSLTCFCVPRMYLKRNELQGLRRQTHSLQPWAHQIQAISWFLWFRILLRKYKLANSFAVGSNLKKYNTE